jgi:hypothetical protein
MESSSVIRASFVAAPAFLLLYAIAHWSDGLDGTYGPGLAWTVGHVMFLLGLLAFGVVILGLFRRARLGTTTRRVVTTVAVIAGLLGLIVFIRVPVIDIITGLRATDHAAMDPISSQLNDYPSAAITPFYNIGPLLFQLGLLALMLQLAVFKPRQLPWWSPIVLLVGFLVLGFRLDLLPLGAILIGIALVPLSFGSRPDGAP